MDPPEEAPEGFEGEYDVEQAKKDIESLRDTAPAEEQELKILLSEHQRVNDKVIELQALAP